MLSLYGIIVLAIACSLSICFISYGIITYFKDKENKPGGKNDTIKNSLIEIESHLNNIKNHFGLTSKITWHYTPEHLPKDLSSIAEDLGKISSKIDRLTSEQVSSKNRLSSGNSTSSVRNTTDYKGSPEKEQRSLIKELPPQTAPPQPASEEYYSEERRYKSIDLSGQDPIAQFVDIYNEASDDRSRRQDFWTEYQNLQRFGNKNAYAQARGETSEFDFCTEDNGDFIAVKLASSPNFMVVPQFGTTITDTSYKEGGFSLVFDCQNYRSGSSYSQVRVIRPAEFERRGEHWELLNQGKLDLQS